MNLRYSRRDVGLRLIGFPGMVLLRGRQAQAEGAQMQKEEHATPSMPPEVARYLRGATEASLQFDFLIGRWAVEGTRLAVDGSVQLKYKADWRAEYLHDRRMVFDDFTILGPTGDEISSFVTLRTYCETTKRWEIAGLAAFQPAMNGEWFGTWSDGEMHLFAEARIPNGQILRNKIRFHDISANGFRWESHNSTDGGTTWIRAAALTASRLS